MKTKQLLPFFESVCRAWLERILFRRDRRTVEPGQCHLMQAGMLIIYLAAISSAAGASLTTDFSTDPGGALLGTARIENGILKLQDLLDLPDTQTPGGTRTATLPMQGSYVFSPIDGAQKVASFTA